MVIPAPKIRLLKGLDVIFFSVRSSFPPVTFVRPLDITCIPYKKKARPPPNVMKLNISMLFVSFKKATLPGRRFISWHPQAESNHQQRFRKPPLYPFNYGGRYVDLQHRKLLYYALEKNLRQEEYRIVVIYFNSVRRTFKLLKQPIAIC